MEIDVFPLAHSKEGFARNFDKAFLGFLIITYIVLAYKIAVAIIGDDGKDGIVSFFLAIPIFIAYYSLFVLVLHCIKSALYAYFKAHRKELNLRADREEYEECIVQESTLMKKELQEKNAVADSSNATQPNSVKDVYNDDSIVLEEQITPNVVTPEALKNIQVERGLKESIEGLKTFMINNNLLREQMRAKKLAEEKKKLDKRKCEICGNIFLAKFLDSRCCSERCIRTQTC